MQVAILKDGRTIEIIQVEPDGSIVFQGKIVSILELNLQGYQVIIS